MPSAHAFAGCALARAGRILAIATCPPPTVLAAWAAFFRHELIAQIRLEEAQAFPRLRGRRRDRLGEEHLAIVLAARALAERLEDLGRRPEPARWRAARRRAGGLQVLLQRHVEREVPLLRRAPRSCSRR